MRIEESIVINRSPNAVFGFLSERSNDPVWMAAVVESEWLDPSATLAVGRRGRMVMKMFGRRTEYVDEVITYEPGRQIAHRTVEGPFPLRTACLCEQARGGCRTTVIAEAERVLGRFGGMLDPLIAKLMGRGFQADLTNLKELLEANASSDAALADAPQSPKNELRRAG